MDTKKIPKSAMKATSKAKKVAKNSSRSVRLVKQAPQNAVEKLIASKYFQYGYPLFAALTLLITSVYWAILGANVQLGNADQLSNGDIMGHFSSFSSAVLPGQHTFLLKWPLFLLEGALGGSKDALITVTVLTTVVTVAAFAFILYRIERRPLVSGTIFLALASTLLLVPPQPYPGGILPVNMAMLTTRNIEYIGYIFSLYFFVRTKKIQSYWFAAGVVLLSIVIASDKLFLALSAGGAALSLLVYALARRSKAFGMTIRWLIGSITAGLLASGLLVLLNTYHVVHIINDTAVSPYGSIHDLHTLALALVYAFFGLLTVVGANPVSDTRLLRQVPHQIIHSTFAIEGLAFVMNLAVLVFGLFVIYQLLAGAIFKEKYDPEDNAQSLALTLVWSTIIAFGSFIVSNHYYPVDARYLQIAFFALFVAIAGYLRQLHTKPIYLFGAGILLTLGVLSGVWGAQKIFHADQSVMAENKYRDTLIAQAFKQRHVSVLVGDYWRVLPTRLASDNSIAVMPMANCTQPLSVLTSTNWLVDLHKNSFAYLLTLDKSPTNYPNCSLKEVVEAYGQPNAVNVIAGTTLHPKELLLFYKSGINFVRPTVESTDNTISTDPTNAITPISLKNLPNTDCLAPTDMNIVAHEDDDILFMNPDIRHSIEAGACIRTIYVTAGNAGQGQYYWIARQEGIETAYSFMTGASTIWQQQFVKLTDTAAAVVAHPVGNTRISLIFLNLPDGNLNGSGFYSSHFESLAKLVDGHLPMITSVRGSSTYTLNSLIYAIEELMQAYRPAVIRTQAEDDSSKSVVEHSDHMAVGRLTDMAYRNYEHDYLNDGSSVPLYFYEGYPIRVMPPNVMGTDLDAKTATFFTYALSDSDVCRSMAICEEQHSNYPLYISRQYSYTK